GLRRRGQSGQRTGPERGRTPRSGRGARGQAEDGRRKRIPVVSLREAASANGGSEQARGLRQSGDKAHGSSKGIPNTMTDFPDKPTPYSGSGGDPEATGSIAERAANAARETAAQAAATARDIRDRTAAAA